MALEGRQGSHILMADIPVLASQCQSYIAKPALINSWPLAMEAMAMMRWSCISKNLKNTQYERSSFDNRIKNSLMKYTSYVSFSWKSPPFIKLQSPKLRFIENR